jgi:pimeloyl-ACP methyl ester carboxylesterase
VLEAFSMPVAGQWVHGTLQVPARFATPGACVLFLVGPSTTRAGPNRIHVAMAAALEEAGIASCRFDYRGRGESTGPEEAVRVPQMIDDSRAVVRRIDELLGRHTQNLLVGNCLGCIVGLRLMEVEPAVSAGVFVGAPEFSEQAVVRVDRGQLRETLIKYSRKLRTPSTWRRLLRGDIDFRSVGQALTTETFRRYRSRLGALEERRYGVAAPIAGRQAAFFWGAADPARVERDAYARFCASRGWTMRADVIADAAHSFGRQQWARALTERVVQQVRQLVVSTSRVP